MNQNIGDQYNYSREELDRMKRRAEIRNRLKREYYSYYRNPLIGSYKIDTYDPGQQRYASALSFQTDNLKKFMKAKHVIAYYSFFLGVPALGGWMIKNWGYGADIEKRIRTGEYTLEQRMMNSYSNGF